LDAVNIYYENTVAALHHAACNAIQRVPCHALKPYWNEELDRLKNDSLFWHRLWTDDGRPSSGALQRIRLACRAKYKLAIRNAYVTFEDKLSDELYLHFVNKNIPDFWKTWNAKFRKNVSRQVNIFGYANDLDIVSEFAVHFTKVFDNSHDDSVAYNDYLNKHLECMKNGLQASYECIDLVDIVRGGYSNRLSSGIFTVIFQLAFWCARIYCCSELPRLATWLGNVAVRTCVTSSVSPVLSAGD